MDFGIPIGIFVVIFVIVWICVYCCIKQNRSQGTVYRYNGTPITIETHAAQPTPVVNPPYPIDPRHPTPASVPAANVGFVTSPYPPQAAGYYPPHPSFGPGYQAAAAMPYPPVNVTPYPTGGAAPYPPGPVAPPPSYSEAVSMPPVNPVPTNEMYAKQSPYNPNY